MLAGGQLYSKKFFFPQISRDPVLWTFIFLMPTCRMDSLGLMREGMAQKVLSYYRSIRISFVLRGEVLQKCNYFTQHVWFAGLKMCEFPKASVFKYSIPLSRQDVFWAREGTHTQLSPLWHTLTLPVLCLPWDAGWREAESVGNCFSGPCLSWEETQAVLESSQPPLCQITVSWVCLLTSLPF